VKSVLLLTVLLGGCALSVEGELPDVEIARHGVVIPGVPLEASLGDSSVYVTITVNPKDHIDVDPSTYRSVKVHQVVFTSTGADLSFVRALDLTMNGSRAAAAPIPVLHYTHAADGAAVGTTLTIPVDPPAEVVGAWKDPPSTIGLQVRGDLPQSDWSLDVSVHLSATIGY
jgi:hypothetical protein